LAAGNDLEPDVAATAPGREYFGSVRSIRTHHRQTLNTFRIVTSVVTGSDVGRELSDTTIEDAQQICRVLACGVPRSRLTSKRLTRPIRKTEHTVEPVPALEMWAALSMLSARISTGDASVSMVTGPSPRDNPGTRFHTLERIPATASRVRATVEASRVLVKV
jgi:hypothetical protein